MENYKHQGIEMTGRIMLEIVTEKFANKRFSRQEAIQYAKNYHVVNGGICQKSTYVPVFKAMTRMDKRFQSVGYGIWQIDDGMEIEKNIVEPKREELSYPVDKVIGEGKESVYVYYYDIYKKHNASIGLDMFPCKIGMSKRESPIDRIISQSPTAYPEYPHVALVIQCEDSRKLESVLHSILNFHNRKIKNSPGSEWYNTNPIEVETIYDSIK